MPPGKLFGFWQNICLPNDEQERWNIYFNLPFYTYLQPAHTLPRVYESLLAQTFRDFEWLIVDDGSSDDTRELIGTWRQDGKISIQYHCQGKSG